jgi:hypothetical protein
MTINGRWESCPNGKFIMWFTINYMILCSPTANAIESNSEIGLRTKGGAGLQYKSRPVIWSGLIRSDPVWSGLWALHLYRSFLPASSKHIDLSSFTTEHNQNHTGSTTNASKFAKVWQHILVYNGVVLRKSHWCYLNMMYETNNEYVEEMQHEQTMLQRHLDCLTNQPTNQWSPHSLGWWIGIMGMPLNSMFFSHLNLKPRLDNDPLLNCMAIPCCFHRRVSSSGSTLRIETQNEGILEISGASL